MNGAVIYARETDRIIVHKEMLPAGLHSELLRRLTVENPAHRDAVKLARPAHVARFVLRMAV